MTVQTDAAAVVTLATTVLNQATTMHALLQRAESSSSLVTTNVVKDAKAHLTDAAALLTAAQVVAAEV